MASPNATFTELVSTTFRRHGKTFIDNVSKNNALLAYLMRNNQFRRIDGGLELCAVVPRNVTFAWSDPLQPRPSRLSEGSRHTAKS